MTPRERSHANDGGSPIHIYQDCELFYFLQGEAMVEIDKKKYPAAPGDIFLVEPGEDHHILAGGEQLPIGIWYYGRKTGSVRLPSDLSSPATPLPLAKSFPSSGGLGDFHSILFPIPLFYPLKKQRIL